MDRKRKNKLSIVPLDKYSLTPLYFQIQAQLLHMIRARELAAGEMLPGEEELMRLYGVSRVAARQALQGLTTQGYAYRQRGRGIFVSQPRVEEDITDLLGFTEEMRALGMATSSRLLSSETVAAPLNVSTRLGIAAGAPAFHLHRLRSAAGVPVALQDVWLPKHRFPGLEKLNFVRRSLYETLRHKYGVRIGAVDEVIEARPANKHEAALLEIPLHASLLVIRHTLLTVEGVPVETGISLYRADRYRAVLRRTVRPR